jgi:hypothetical protein
MALATLKRQLGALKASLPPPAGQYESFLALVAREARDPANSQARREPEIYCTLSHAEKLDVHRREIERLEAEAPGIDAALWEQFIARERELIEELEARAQELAREAAELDAAPEEDEEAPISRRRGVPVRAEAQAPPDRLRDYKAREGEDRVWEPKHT